MKASGCTYKRMTDWIDAMLLASRMTLNSRKNIYWVEKEKRKRNHGKEVYLVRYCIKEV